MTLEEFFATSPPHERPVVEAVLEFLATLGPIHVEPVSVGVFVKKHGSFVELRTMARWVALWFGLDRTIVHPRIARKPVAAGRRVVHVVNLRSPEDLTDDVRAWLTEAYALAP